jgi:hypothetical protein
MSSTPKLAHIDRDQLIDLMQACDGQKSQMAACLGVGYAALCSRLRHFNLHQDGRVVANASRKKPRPSKEELSALYQDKNLTLVAIGRLYGVSNVTVKKWCVDLQIPLLSHAATHRLKVQPLIQASNQAQRGYTHFFATDEGKRKVAEAFTQKYGVPYHPIGSTSQAEIEVLTYLNSLRPGFSKAHLHGIELDCFHPEAKFAVEYCGLYWHTETRKGKQAHVKKYQICAKEGIRLITIFEDEWQNRRSQIEGFLAAALGISTTTIGARSCTIEWVDRTHTETRDFLNLTHIQGAPNPAQTQRHAILRYQGQIVSAMSFGRHHRGHTDPVLSRYAVRSGFCIRGGAQRLFAFARHIYTGRIISWSDSRWTDGALYSRLGFTLESQLPIDYSYVQGKRRVSKQSMTKKKLQCGTNETEYQKAMILGWDRIWDCGKKRWCFNETTE